MLITNQLRRAPATMIGRYAERMIIENDIIDGIDFFYMDALSSVTHRRNNKRKDKQKKTSHREHGIESLKVLIVAKEKNS
ncbi:MAG: hypothetical protein L0Y67_09055 [Gammaproteobacteria bacterium]|nr:hypothetical protein [Gammaproteobacteria bacterium]